MLKVLADEHVIGPLVQALRQRGVDVSTAVEIGLKSQEDARILSTALRQNRLVLTNDADFLVLAADHAARNEDFAPVVYWPQQRRAVGQLLAQIMPLVSQHDYRALCSRVFFI